jgi:pimeloyl-ACP methyl ester carboxylesterase
MPPALERIRDLAVYRHRGEGPQIVLVHGAMDRGAGMLKVARRLGGREVVRYDRRGYGRSVAAPPTKRFSEQVDDLRAVLGGRPTVLFGHSYGGVVAMALASTAAPEVLGVACYEAPRAWEQWWPPPPPPGVDPADTAEGFMRRMVGDQGWEALPSGTRAARRAEGPALVAELREQRTRRYDAAAIGVPVVIGVGELSGERAHRAAQLTVGEAPLGELVVVSGAGHGAPTSHPAQISELVLAAHPG